MSINIYHQVQDSEIINNNIDYKQLNEEDFEDKKKNIGIKTKKTTIELGDSEYLSEVALDHIDLKEHNTVVINSSVGQGKSTLAIEIAVNYYIEHNEEENPQYTIIFAVPHKSLVKQYIKDVTEGLNKKGIDANIPDYSNLIQLEEQLTFQEKIKEIEKASSTRMHIITVNCLLGNPGDDALEQGFVKRSYLEKIIKINTEKEREIILIFDEIHDAIHNFKQELIFNLWKFRTSNVLHKIFILSATFNEASKIVIKYLAELTYRKLQIIESKRIQRKKELSNLHIHLTKSQIYDFDSEELYELFTSIIKKHSNINILSYSKSLCSRIADGTNGYKLRELLISKHGGINLCLPEEYHITEKQKVKKGIPSEISYSDKYLLGACNIGTTFKTGISIKEKNSGFVIILPSKYSMQGFIKSGDYGIFTDGTNSIIQAFARVREESEIYIIAPYPKMFIQYQQAEGTYLQNLLQIDMIKHYIYPHDNLIYSHYEYSEQRRLILNQYNKIVDGLKIEIDEVNRMVNLKKRDSLPYLQFPTFDMYCLSIGEKVLYSYYAMFGRDLSAYVLWAAFNNQFVNCKLKIISTTKAKESFNIDNIQSFLLNYFLKNYSQSLNNIQIHDNDLYNNFYNRINAEMIILTKSSRNTNEYSPIPHYTLKRHIMAFVQKFTKGNRRMNYKYLQNPKFVEKEFSSNDYLLCCISNVMQFKGTTDDLLFNTLEMDLIFAYKQLSEIRELFIKPTRIMMEDEKGFYIYPNIEEYPIMPFTNNEIEKIVDTIKIIKKDSNYTHFRKFQTTNFLNNNEAIKDIYKELKDTFFSMRMEKATITSPEGRRRRINRYYVDINEIPLKRSGINLLYKFPYNRMEKYEKEEDYEQILIDEYNFPNWEDAYNTPITGNDIEITDKLKQLLEGREGEANSNLQNSFDQKSNNES